MRYLNPIKCIIAGQWHTWSHVVDFHTRTKMEFDEVNAVTAIKACEWRQNNVLYSLRCDRTKLADVAALMSDGSQHMLAMVLARKGQCVECASSPTCRHICKLFQSTRNSKRSIHLYLFWTVWLGWNFPITDAMVLALRALLEPTCDLGIRYVCMRKRANRTSIYIYILVHM